MALDAVCSSVVRGFHVYKDVLTPVTGEELCCQHEVDNPEDEHAVLVMKGDLIVGHVPRELSGTSWYFIQHGGEIQSTVSGPRHATIYPSAEGIGSPMLL